MTGLSALLYQKLHEGLRCFCFNYFDCRFYGQKACVLRLLEITEWRCFSVSWGWSEWNPSASHKTEGSSSYWGAQFNLDSRGAQPSIYLFYCFLLHFLNEPSPPNSRDSNNKNLSLLMFSECGCCGSWHLCLSQREACGSFVLILVLCFSVLLCLHIGFCQQCQFVGPQWKIDMRFLSKPYASTILMMDDFDRQWSIKL